MLDPVSTAILQSIQYADLFDYPLTPDEIHRYLIGIRTPRAEITHALDDPARLNGAIARVGGYVTLPRREHLVAERARLRAHAQKQMPRARFYARLIAQLPFVRMIALTGALAMQNARDGDIDLMIVTAPRRLWLTRALIIALVYLARARGDKLCPNFLVTENALELRERNLYTAHEIAQMIPFYGMAIYARLRALNAWAETFLPNMNQCDAISEIQLNPRSVSRALKRVSERMLAGRMGDALERWERTRKIAKLSAQIRGSADDAAFSADVCRGFMSGHGQRILAEYESRITNY
ncbi:MAG: hypothetical protein HY327_12395 [Chloroflexi bacterium]|nr:hypothetical protein [Chloroflexota bacterium]